MKYEGMVHALEEIQRLLKPGGCLIDIHPVREAPLIKVYQEDRTLLAEPSPVYTDEDYRQADDALAQVVRRRLFVVEGSSEFDFLIYGSSVAELADFLAQANAYDDRPADEVETARKFELAARVEAIMRAAGAGADVAYHERGRMACLRPIKS